MGYDDGHKTKRRRNPAAHGKPDMGRRRGGEAVSLLPGHGKPQSVLLARAAALGGRHASVRTEDGKSSLLVQGQAAPQDADAGSAGDGDDPVDP